MQDIAQSTYDFGVMRANGSVYVDKTAMLHALIKRDRDAFYFISRPRRFGKSLMLSTLKYLFQGRRDLFKGLAIDKMDYDWAEYPILHFNFATMDTETLGAFREGLVARVQEAFAEAKVDYDPDSPRTPTSLARSRHLRGSAASRWSSSSMSMMHLSEPR